MDNQDKLILEPLAELDYNTEEPLDLEVELSQEQKESFEVATISSLLVDELNSYSYISGILNSDDENLNAMDYELIEVIEHVLEDKAVIIGKLQQALKDLSSNGESIIDGEESVKD